MEFDKIKSITEQIITESRKRLVGYDNYMKSILRVLFANGHVILEGNPGIAKTLAANTLAEILGMDFGRIQFTPDLMPSDVTGVNVFNQKTLEFEYLQGPVFTNFLLCDEINRSPPKTQAALLEAMQERQVSVEGMARKLPDPFLVIATQNPLEQAGTYNLPEAQIDRFLIRLIIDLPPKEVEKTMLRLKDTSLIAAVDTLIDRNTIKAIQEKIHEVKISDEIIEYIVDIVHKTRNNPNIEIPASPRASIALMMLGKVNAAMAGRNYVQPDDVKSVSFEVLNHRVGLSHEAELDRISINEVIDNLLSDSTVSI
ncbi:MAG: AAA family ATPase [Candidatus Heimdallarchaeota archaeon]|nr:AAA family ATPase [Candidatus Heimdallarchaeota archaeon]